MSKTQNYNFYLKNGYCILNVFNKKDIDELRKKIIKKLNILSKKRIFNLKNKKLGKYDKLVTNDKLHSKLMNSNKRYIKLPRKIIKKIYKGDVLYIFKKIWGHDHYAVSWIGDASKKQFKLNSTGFRIARPHNYKTNTDVAGPHIDLHAGGRIRNDFLEQITMWIPIVGFSSKYTLRIAPKSQKYFHNKNLIKGKKITLGFSKKYEKKFRFIRPNLKLGQVILLHSNLLHGSSINAGIFSRVSCDARIVNLKRFTI